MKVTCFLEWAVILFILSVCLPVHAKVFPFNGKRTVVGIVHSYVTRHGESLIEIAKRYDVGYNAITAVNPAVDPFVPGDGTKIWLPTAWILPEHGIRQGIVINLSELRLYYFYLHNKSTFVNTFPIGIGISGKDTPLGEFKVVEKIKDPVWDVPESIRRERPELPKAVPPGPENPLGSHALRLSLRDILIHGTNKPYGLGMEVSHGCIRLDPADIAKLYNSVPQGTKVIIVRRPVKIGTKYGKVYIELHDDNRGANFHEREAMRLLEEKGLLRFVDREKLRDALKHVRAIPVDISK
jgi:L,D-transpeptidase ErfK/SrfK